MPWLPHVLTTAQNETWVDQIRRGEPRAIARAITAVESGNDNGRDLLKQIAPAPAHTVVVGITGAPGSGKSTLVDAFITALRKQDRTVGVLAVDPTSPVTGGALLGDRVRMQSHANDPGVFIRSMATRGTQGGLAAATRDAVAILAASRKDFVLIETVGVGQGEVAVADVADVTLLVLVPGTGDDVQAMKAGIMEIADIFVLNKSDLPGADRLEQDIRAAIALAPHHDTTQRMVRTIATEGTGADELLAAIAEVTSDK